MGIKHAPVVIRLSSKDIKTADLMTQLAVDRHALGKELLKQPSRYAWWASLHAAVASKVEVLEGREEELYSELYKELTELYKGKLKATDMKQHIVRNKHYQKLRRRLWRWRESERFLKGAVKSFEQRKDVMQSYAADQRKERDSEPKVRKRDE